MNETLARQLVTARAGGLCELCKADRPGSWAHRLPRGQGGQWRPSNGLHLCGDGTRGCHGWSERNREASYASGWLLLSGLLADPLAMPVWLQPIHLPPGWYVLDDDACFTWLDPVTENLPEVPAELPPWALARHRA